MTRRRVPSVSAKGPIGADELLAILANDEGFQRRARERDRQLAATAAERKRKLAPFTKDIAAAGVHGTYDPGTGVPHDDPRLLEIALSHLARDGYDDWTRATIARRLAVKGAASHWNEILALYVRAAGHEEREALAAALAACARGSNVDQLIELVQDASLGPSRVLFLRPINRLKRVKGNAFVAQLVDDPALGKEATAIMQRRSTKR